MGSYRFFLAFCVLYSHVFGLIMGWNVGVVAVISFYIITGYVMTILTHKYYKIMEDIPSFYLDRVVRIFPQYLFYLLLTILGVGLFDLQNSFWQDFGVLKIALNAMILPIGYYMFGLENALYITPAWSLGLELTFYIFFPFFLHLNRKMRCLIVAFSLVIFTLALVGQINTDWFGYRLLPGTFYIFVIGAALAKPNLITPTFPYIVGSVAILVVFTILLTPQLYTMPFNKEVVTGTAMGTFMVALLRGLRFSKFDELMGNLSYGIFLNHWLILVALENFSIPKIIVPFISVALAAVSYRLVERPAINWRRNIRKQRQLAQRGEL